MYVNTLSASVRRATNQPAADRPALLSYVGFLTLLRNGVSARDDRSERYSFVENHNSAAALATVLPHATESLNHLREPAQVQEVGSLAVPASTMRVTKEEALDRLRMIRELQDDWNGNGAAPFSTRLINEVANLIDTLPLVPLPVPSTRGGIALQFEDEHLGYLELLIFDDRRVELYSASPSGERDVSDVINFSKIRDEVQKFEHNGRWKS